MAGEQILVYVDDDEYSQELAAALESASFNVLQIKDTTTITALSRVKVPDLIILSDQIRDRNTGIVSSGLDLLRNLLRANPSLAIILITNTNSGNLAVKALRMGALDFLDSPRNTMEVLQSVNRVVERRHQVEAWTKLEVRLNTRSLQQKVDTLELLQGIGHSITSSLDLDIVLTEVVDAAVKLTDAEEGSLLLLDDSTGELYIRAARNFREEFVHTFRVPVSDSLAGEVIRTGKPVLLDETTPQKIKTAYLVQSLLYVPLILKDRVIGVLGVDNRQPGHSFNEYHLTLVSALAGYTAIAIQNASLYSQSELERKKLETILTDIQDAVIIMSGERRLVMANQAALEAFGIPPPTYTGQLIDDVISNNDLLELLTSERSRDPYRGEISLDDGRVFNAQVTHISEIGAVVTMQDITHLKELDRIKSDFVNTVSHDLRSPLTAILGYIALIERSGPINPQQQDFIKRVESSVQTITALINDLLDLGKIEAGFDVRKENVSFNAILNIALDSLRNQIAEKNIRLELSIPPSTPNVLGNPVRLRQTIINLVGNAIKYLNAGGLIRIRVQAEAEQLIFQVSDNGPGIPSSDQPYIFDKFYRASNIPGGTPGTGLGLAIVRSIVENHRGRIWVESTPGAGSTFTVVLPTARRI